MGAEIPGAVNTIAFGVIGMSHAGVKKVLRQAWDSPSRSRPSAFSGTWRVGSITMPPASRASIYEGWTRCSPVIRLGLPAQLRRSLGCTNAIDNLMAVLRQVCRNVERWRNHGWHCDGPDRNAGSREELPAFEGAQTTSDSKGRSAATSASVARSANCQQKLGSSRLPHHFQQAPGGSGTSCSSTRNGSALKASSASFSVEVEQPERPNVQTRMVVR